MLEGNKRWKLHATTPVNGRREIDSTISRATRVKTDVFVTAESDICTFATRTEHFHVTNKPSTGFFTPDTRPKALKELYEVAAIVAVRSLDSLRRDGSSMDMFLCTPILGKRRRDQSLEIESRVVSKLLSLSLSFSERRDVLADLLRFFSRFSAVQIPVSAIELIDLSLQKHTHFMLQTQDKLDGERLDCYRERPNAKRLRDDFA